MATFWYRGVSEQGRVVRGRLTAASRAQAMALLKERGCFATKLYEQAWSLPLWRKRLSVNDLEPFCRQLALLLESGISLLRGLELMQKEHLSPAMAQWIEQLSEQIATGESLTAAIKRTGERVPPLLTDLTAVGEQHGRLGEALRQAADQFAWERRLSNELLTAMLYPILVLGIMVLAVAAMLVFVVPSLVQTYRSLDAPLPWLTRGLIAVSDFAIDYGVILLFGLLVIGAGAVVAFRYLLDKPPGQMLWRKVARHLPFCDWWAQRYFVQFAQMLGQLLQGGVLLLEALHMVGKHYQGILYREELQDLSAQALCGRSLTEGLARCSFVPAAALQMIHIGEESGHLAEMLLHSSNYYGQQLNQRFNRLARLLEPILIVLLGMLVLLMAGSLFLPIIAAYRYIV